MKLSIELYSISFYIAETLILGFIIYEFVVENKIIQEQYFDY